MEITKEQIEKSFELFKFVNSNTDVRVQIWEKDRKIELNRVYYHLVKNKCQAIWMDFEVLNEYKIKRILKKINIIPYEFFMYYNNDRIRIGFRVKGVIK